MLALATNTWHAYNDFGGPNLYTGGTQVSMRRPMSAGYLYKPPGKGRRVTGTGAPDPQNAAHVGYIQINHLSGYAGSAGWPDWELPFIEWAECNGFEIGVCTNADLEEHPEVLDGASLYLSVGHDEYWSQGVRDTVEAFVAGGGNPAFFSGNTSLWQVRIEGDDADVMVGYKAFFKNDPLMGTDRESEVTTFWSDVVVGRPENHMTSYSFTFAVVITGSAGTSPQDSAGTRCTTPATGYSKAQGSAMATCWVREQPLSATSATVVSSRIATDCPIPPARMARHRRSRFSEPAPRSISPEKPHLVPTQARRTK